MNSSSRREIREVHTAPAVHWVGDGFPVRSLISPQRLGTRAMSPFLLLDYGGPHRFEPVVEPRGVGAHPHKGFETVTIVYESELAHRDSTGSGGTIGPGDVQWMTAGSGIVHEEMHSPAFTAAGGLFEMVQLWVNLPAKDKGAAPGYQTLRREEIPGVALPDGGGLVRVIAGSHQGVEGPARTFTPLHLWDARLSAGAHAYFELEEGFNTAIAVLRGDVVVNGTTPAASAELVIFAPEGRSIELSAGSPSIVLVLSGQPIDEPVVAYGPFVMNTMQEIGEAMQLFTHGLDQESR